MKIPVLSILFALSSTISFGQLDCIKHWSHNKSPCVELDSIVASINLQHVDTIYCDSFTKNTTFDANWYTSFYKKHFGNYFSNPRCVCFIMFLFKENNEPKTNEMHITQFVLTDRQISAFRKKYGSFSKKHLTYTIEAYTSYKYIIKGNSIYFISTETFSLAEKRESFFEEVFSQIQKR